MRHILLAATVLLAIAPFSLTAATPTTPSKPNIVFIFADDWGYGDLGCHGSKFCRTPNIDRMAREGIDFQNFTVCHPVCSPSRTAVMTGQFPARHCIHRHFSEVSHHRGRGMPDWLDPKAPMLPKLLQRAAYATGHFGKWHLTNRAVKDAPLPTEYGYDEYGAFNLPGEQIKTHETCARAVKFIRTNQDRPFFLNVWLHETHTPHYPRKEYLEKFKHLSKQQQVYAAVVAEADAGIGTILKTLNELELEKNTLVIFSSDNGPEWTGKFSRRPHQDRSTGPGLGTYYSVGETAGLKGRKRSLFAGGVRVPFIVRWPGMVPGGKVDRTSVITAVDLLPSFLELASIKPPEDYQPDGESFVAALRGKAFTRSRPIFWQWRGGHDRPNLWPHVGVRDGKWKLLLNRQSKQVVLYDIESDWAEKNDLSSAQPEVVKTLTDKIVAWKATLPQKPPAHCFSKQRKKLAK